MEFTKEQNDAIYKKGNNILVAAAAGSGKTSVLVERIIQKILNDGVDIDKLLVCTFTNAAASEMRERVMDAIYQKLDEEPDNPKLLKQISLLGKANISTIHSFCLDVVKNNFFEIDISPNFRIATGEELSLMKQDCLDELFEEKYDEDDKDFLSLVDTYASYRGDDPLQELVLSIYEFAQSAPFPIIWLEEKVQMYNKENYKDIKDFSETIWGRIIIDYIKDYLTDAKNSFKTFKKELEKYPELDKYYTQISNDIDVLREVYNSTVKWDDLYNSSLKFNFGKWPSDKKLDYEIKNKIKEDRSIIKTNVNNKLKELIPYDSESAFEDIFGMYEILSKLKNLVIEFSNIFQKNKNEKNIVDFNDIEHFALQILQNEDIAKSYKDKFVEIAIDEYQDSNQVQEEILTSISRGNNLFTVGDVKQSIYKFRRACPELFMEKYDNYSIDGNDKGIKIKLFNNFRSRKEILNIVNTIFQSIMTKDLGEIDYTQEEYLNPGASYEEVENGLGIPEICVIDNKIDDDDIYIDSNGDEVIDELQEYKNEELEAKYVAKRIKELINQKKTVCLKNSKREITYKDIVILLRSTKNSANIFERELVNNNIPVYSDGVSEYLETLEISVMLNLLKILDNPIDDIAIVSVLRSPMFGFTDNEILNIRLIDKETSFWKTILKALDELEDIELKDKLKDFVNKIKIWQEKKTYLPISRLIWEIYTETGFLNYVNLMPNGQLRVENLKKLFDRAREFENTSFKGLYNFIKFMEKIKSGNSDLDSAKIIGENENVVRIMSIHKSKGLEFPVVFLCTANKKINFNDLKGDVILHKDLGLGVNFIDTSKKLKYPILSKEAIKINLRKESISEEMRVLYVALTRAKEKLIITAVEKDESKRLFDKLKIDEINPIVLKKYSSYMDWFEIVDTHLKENKPWIFKIIDRSDIFNGNETITENTKHINFSEYNNFEEIERSFNWQYKNIHKTKLPIKSTVSIINDLENDTIDYFEMQNKNMGLNKLIPEFMQDEKIKGARRGTITHLILQKADFNSINSFEDLREYIEKLQADGFISEEEKNSINLNSIWIFINSDFCNRIKRAKKIYKEKAFCIKVPALSFIKDAKPEDEISVQGIIDLFYIDENDNIVLVDYKTDYVEKNDISQLVDKYSSQIMLYKKALELSGKKVSDCYIYSLFLNKEVKI